MVDSVRDSSALTVRTDDADSGCPPNELGFLDQNTFLPRLDELVDLSDGDSDEDDDESVRTFESRAKEYAQLHQQIQSSTILLTSLASFLSTFQSDLSSVSGEIASLQARSKAIERRGGGRRTIEKPLSTLVESITFPPSLVHTISETPVSEDWLDSVPELERILTSMEARKTRVKAAADAVKVGEALRITATQKISSHLHTLLKPLSATIATNLPVLQTSVLLKYAPLWAFLSRRSPSAAADFKRAYVWRARGYHETGFRRYARTLSEVGKRWGVGTGGGGADLSLSALAAGGGRSTSTTSPPQHESLDPDSPSSLLACSRSEASNVTLAYQADDPQLKVAPEALFRSILLVLLDNASAEYAFLVRFFQQPTKTASLDESIGGRGRVAMERRSEEGGEGLFSPSRWTAGDEGDEGVLEESLSSRMVTRRSRLGSVMSESASQADGDGWTGRDRARLGSVIKLRGEQKAEGEAEKFREESKEIALLWHQVFDPAITYCQQLVTSLLSLTPAIPLPLPSLLAMIRLTESALALATSRSAPYTNPIEGFLQSQRLTLWPLWKKAGDTEVDTLRKLADGVEGKGGGWGILSGGGAGRGVRDAGVERAGERYSWLFAATVALSKGEDEAMLFQTMSRLRNELVRIIIAQAAKQKDVATREAFSSSVCDRIIGSIRGSVGSVGATRAAEEISFWDGLRKRHSGR